MMDMCPFLDLSNWGTIQCHYARFTRLTEGLSEAWPAVNHIVFWSCMNCNWQLSGYLNKAIQLADTCVGALKVQKFSTSAVSNTNDATPTEPQFSSATLDVTHTK